jgi:hypothetical protein
VGQAVKIQWKDPKKSLTKLYPRKVNKEDDDITDFGSFFNFFENETDTLEVSVE